jgi:hypothetical protein
MKGTKTLKYGKSPLLKHNLISSNQSHVNPVSHLT